MPWTEPYLALNGTDAASTSEVGGYTLYPSNQTYSYISFDVTNAARKWKEGEPNYGLLVWATNEYEAGRDIRFHSREHTTKVPFMEISCARHSASVTLEADVVCTRIGTTPEADKVAADLRRLNSSFANVSTIVRIIIIVFNYSTFANIIVHKVNDDIIRFNYDAADLIFLSRHQSAETQCYWKHMYHALIVFITNNTLCMLKP